MSAALRRPPRESNGLPSVLEGSVRAPKTDGRRCIVAPAAAETQILEVLFWLLRMDDAKKSFMLSNHSESLRTAPRRATLYKII